MRKINYLAFLLSGLLSAQTTFTLVKDIYPGATGSGPSNFTLYKGKLYFSASSSVNGTSIGTELWESDGTEAGTKLVSDNIPGSSSTSPGGLFTFNDKIYFSGTNIVNGTNVSGLLLSYDDVNGIQTVSTVSKFSTNFTKVGNTLYFKATNTSVTPNTQRLYYLDSSGQSVIADDNLNVNTIGFIGNKVLANAQLANAASPFLTQLFSFDGNSTSLVKTINPSTSSYPQYFLYSPALGKTFFNANGGNGGEPWMTDGTEAGTSIVKDINVSNATAGSNPTSFTEYNGKVYFAASDGLTSGIELWVTDGTEQGTKMFKDIIPGTTGSFPEKLTVYKNKLYFFATNASNVKQLWESDGTDAGTKALVSIGTASALVIYNDTLYFSGRINNTDTLGVELYKINLQDDTLAASEMQNNNISVYPNPSRGEVFISNLKSGKFELYDTTGKLIKEGNFSDSKILLSAQQGVYVLKLKSENSKTNFVTRVIIK